jgi:hypothetical protein
MLARLDAGDSKPPLALQRKDQEMPNVPMPRPAIPSKAPPPKAVPAPKPGSLAELQLKQRRIALDQERMDKRERATLKLDIFQTRVTRRAKSWMIAARLVGEAYKIADNSYKETLQKKAASDALETQIFFSILTVATSGALGWVSYAAAQSKGGVESALRDAVESSIQATAGEVFSANGPLLFPPRGDSTVSADPQVYQDELENNVDSLFMDVLQAFIKIRQSYLDCSLEAWDKYDEAKEAATHQEWQRKADELAGKDDLPSVAWMARELERGRWVKYVLDNHSYRDFGIFRTADTPDDVGSAVRSRLVDLGISTAKPLPRGPYVRYGGGGTAPADVLFGWAKNYTVRKFTDEKKNPKGGGPDHQ